MSYQFNHKPKGSLIGSGDYQFRHFGEEEIQIPVPTLASSPTYSGSSVSPTWNNYDSEQITIGGVYSAIEAGTYTASFTPKEGYKWNDGTDKETKYIQWVVNKLRLTVPSQSNTPQYTGSSISPTWNNYNSTYMTLGGTSSAIEPNDYTATFTLNNVNNCEWSDSTTVVKSVNWTLYKATPTFTASTSSYTWSIELTSSLTFSYTYSNPLGETPTISASSSKSSIIQVSSTSSSSCVLAAGVNISTGRGGTITITATASETTHYLSASVTCAIKIAAAFYKIYINKYPTSSTLAWPTTFTSCESSNKKTFNVRAATSTDASVTCTSATILNSTTTLLPLGVAVERGWVRPAATASISGFNFRANTSILAGRVQFKMNVLYSSVVYKNLIWNMVCGPTDPTTIYTNFYPIYIPYNQVNSTYLDILRSGWGSVSLVNLT